MVCCFFPSIFEVLDMLIVEGKLTSIRAIDISNTVNLSFETVLTFFKCHGRQLFGVSYAGNSKVTEQFWTNSIKFMKNLK